MRLKENFKFVCPYCNTHLLNIACTIEDENKVQQRAKFCITKCLQCGNKIPYTKVFDGTTNVLPANPKYSFEDLDTEEIEHILICTLTMSERK